MTTHPSTTSSAPPTSPIPSLSVAIATHDAGPLLLRAVLSALEQDPPPVEVVVCDDGSTDGSLEALALLRDRVRVVRHAANRGEAAAKNTAVAATSSDVVVLLDADDEFLPGRLRALSTLLAAHPGADIVTTDALLLDGDRVVGRWYTPEHPVPQGDQRMAVLSRNPVFGHPAVRRAAFDAVGGFDPQVRFAADWDCWVRMVLAGSRIAVDPEPLSLYRIHASNSSADRRAMAEGRLQVLRRIAARDDLTPPERELVRERVDLQERLLRREQLKSALLRGDGSVLARALAVARDRRQPPKSRVLAVVVAALPGPATAALRRRRIGPGGAHLEGGGWRRRLTALWAARLRAGPGAGPP